MEKKLVIIDGSSLLYRAFYALPPTMTSPDGIPTNAVYGFLRMLLGLYRDLDPEYMAVTFDKDRHTLRTEMYEGYKATRKPAPDELVPQFDLIRDVMQVMGVAVYSLDGYEGDDILGTLSLRYEKEMPVNIVTGDRDALQLSSSRTTVFLTQKGITNMAAMTPEAVFEKYHIEPRQVIDMKALMGDTALYAVVAELADALSSGGSGVIRESSNLSDRTTKMRKSSSIGWAFLLRLPEWSVGLFSLAACLAPPCGRYFCIGILRKRRSFAFAARRRMCTRSPWEASLPGAIMI